MKENEQKDALDVFNEYFIKHNQSVSLNIQLIVTLGYDIRVNTEYKVGYLNSNIHIKTHTSDTFIREGEKALLTGNVALYMPQKIRFYGNIFHSEDLLQIEYKKITFWLPAMFINIHIDDLK